MGNEEQWLPSASCSRDRVLDENVWVDTVSIEDASVEPRMSKLVCVRSVCSKNMS